MPTFIHLIVTRLVTIASGKHLKNISRKSKYIVMTEAGSTSSGLALSRRLLQNYYLKPFCYCVVRFEHLVYSSGETFPQDCLVFASKF